MKQNDVKECQVDIWPSQDFKDRVCATIASYLHSGGSLSIKDGSGPIEALEEKFRSYYQKNYAIATSSGTAALHSALVGIGTSKGDEIICQTSTFHAAITPILHCNGIPLLCDIDLFDGNISLDSFGNISKKNVKAVVITHMWGNPAKMEALVASCKKNGIIIIEDCSHAHATIVDKKKVSSWGDIAIFSMQESKMVLAGEGGMLITDSKQFYEQALLLGQFGLKAKNNLDNHDYHILWETGYGLKYRIHPLAALCALESFADIENNANNRSRRINIMYDYLSDFPFLSFVREPNADSRYTYFSNKVRYLPEYNDNVHFDQVLKILNKNDFAVRNTSHKPLHLLPYFQGHVNIYPETICTWPRYTDHSFPNANMYFSSLLSFPRFDNCVSNDTIHIFGEILRKTLKENFK